MSSVERVRRWHQWPQTTHRPHTHGLVGGAREEDQPEVRHCMLPLEAKQEVASKEQSSEAVLVGVAPHQGRLFLFPHKSPHAGAACIQVPKIMLRAELVLNEV